MTSKFKLSLLSLLLATTAFALIVPQPEPEPLLFQDHDFQDFEPEIIEIEEEHFPEGTRTLMPYPKLRIATDFEHVVGGAGTPEFKEYVQTQLIPAIVDWFGAAFKSKYPPKDLISSSAKTLCGFTTPKVLATGVRADIFFFFNTKYDPYGGWAAATTLCAISSSKKPLIVNIGINTYSINTVATPDKNPLTHDLYLTTLTHEFIHGLGMNGVLYKYFVDKSGEFLTDHIKKLEIAGEERTVLDIEPLTTRLRNYYGCNTIPGIIMENEGGAHLERRYFQYEVMSTGGIQGAKISEISMAFLEGTGWWIADYSYAEPYFFGKGQGCDFVYGKCEAALFDDYCEGSGIACTGVGLSGGYCKSDSKSESCRFIVPQTEFNCDNPNGIYYTPLSSRQVYGRGLGSKCFSGNLTTYKPPTEVKQASYCFTYNCVGEGLKTTLEVNFGTSVVTCAQKGLLTVQGYNGFLNCPDPLTFCSTIGKPTCLKNCFGRGTCVNGRCECNKGFEGVDCGFVKV